MKHILLFESYNKQMPIESTIYSDEDEEAGYYSGMLYEHESGINTWILSNGYNNSYNDITKYGLPIAFLDRIEIEEEYRGQGLGNEA